METFTAAAYPIITHDPYFSVWFNGKDLPGHSFMHWSTSPLPMVIEAEVDGTIYLLAGSPSDAQHAEHLNTTMDAMSTSFTLQAGPAMLELRFTSPLLLDDLDVMSRPLTYLSIRQVPTPGPSHRIRIKVAVSDGFVMDRPGTDDVNVHVEESEILVTGAMSAAHPKMLERAGDDLRIEWGEVYLSVEGVNGSVTTRPRTQHATLPASDTDETRNAWKSHPYQPEELSWLIATAELNGDHSVLFSFAFDDIHGISWFDTPLLSYWQRDGQTIQDVIWIAHAEYDEVMERALACSEALYQEAERSGGDAYAALCVMAYRQSIAAHKLALSPAGDLFFISKENFSNGCAATVDITYPSAPLYLRYNPELVAGMLRPVLEYASMDRWPWPFAPHDLGTYPLLHGQVYGGKDGAELRYQMPVEESANMLITLAAYLRAGGSPDLAREYFPLLLEWTDYLVENGADPGDQLCTDDFAGHLAHNVNLSAKSLMGIASMGLICKALGKKAKLRAKKTWADAAEDFIETARDLAHDWHLRAWKPDGTYRLTFDDPEGWSLKYNLVWDIVFGLKLFPEGTLDEEALSYPKRLNRYGVPLDSRKDYTKSDWEIWAGCLTAEVDPEGFEAICEAMCLYYAETPDRNPMTDWYETITGRQQHFQARAVVGGIFMKLLIEAGGLR